jgi:hypothetical protein
MAYSHEKYLQNKEAAKAAQKRYYLKNREKILARQKKYDSEHKEQINKRHKEKKYYRAGRILLE